MIGNMRICIDVLDVAPYNIVVKQAKVSIFYPSLVVVMPDSDTMCRAILQQMARFADVFRYC